MKEVTVFLMGTQPIPSLQQCCHAHSIVQEFLKEWGGGSERVNGENFRNPTTTLQPQSISSGQFHAPNTGS